ncbi:efflux RND transporter periplasmic adaptor subunit [Planctomycetota bacterium]
MKTKWFIVLGAGLFLAGLLLGSAWSGGDADHGHGEEGSGVTTWTCSMHPEIQLPQPGPCPKCGMDLIPLKTDTSAKLGRRELRLSERARALAEIRTALVKREFVPVEVRMTGKVAYDETRLAYITARMAGRIDRLFVNYAGIPVKTGDHMVYFYSPALMTAQEELLQSLKTYVSAPEGMLKNEGLANLNASRDKLKLWDITPEQIQTIEKRGKADDHMTIYAPLGGIVIGKHVEEGAYIKTGTRIYTIADLSQVWIFLDAYESDLQWLRYGQNVEFSTKAYPGKGFKGRIAFIDPILNDKTRTVRVRVTVDNTSGMLKPGMFIKAVVKAQVTAEGAIVERELAGKWISPMHPEIIKDEPGNCDVCDMPLVKAESLGYVDAGETQTPPLVIPASAPLITGKRAVVYVRSENSVDIFKGKEIVLGPRAGDYYIVKSGLEEGETVVVQGNFKIDSALQIQAKPSMMSPQGGGPAPGHHHGPASKINPLHKMPETEHVTVPDAFHQSLDVLFEAYFSLQKALADDDAAAAARNSKHIQEALAAIEAGGLNKEAMGAWKEISGELKTIVQALLKASAIEKQREHFSQLSESLVQVAGKFGHTLKSPVVRFACSMAFKGRGATWLQSNADLKNPYYGGAMLKCGDMVESFVPFASAEQETKAEGHKSHGR